MKRYLLILLGIFGLILILLWRGNSETAVRGKASIQTYDQPDTQAQQVAQAVALADPGVRSLTQGQRAELFTIQPLGPHYTNSSELCASSPCQQVAIYNYDTNETITVVVDVARQEVLDVLHQPHMQPGITPQLAQKAMDIVLTHPQVIAELGYQPTVADMAPVAAGVRHSICAQHLCASPTFRLENRILWTIVDLTDETLVAINWTDVEEDGRFHSITGISDCPPAGSVDQMGWQLSYETTATDGLQIVDASFMGRSVLKSAKLVEWHVDYNGTYVHAGFLDVTGCGGVGGGFFVYPYGDTQLVDLIEDNILVGFELVQDFRMNDWGAACNYRYEQRMQFYNDGRFRIVSGAYGRGCGLFAQYRPLVRIDLALDPANQEQIGVWDGAHWQQPTEEIYLTPDIETFGPGGHPLADNRAMLWLMNQAGAGYYLEPGLGQHDDGGRGDAPFVYIVKYNEAEGVLDLPVFGGLCCENDHQQGPHFYVNNEEVQNENIVLWYVAQQGTEVLQTDPPDYYCWTVNGEPNPETYPCFTGPMFIPFGYEDGSITPGFEVEPRSIVFPEIADFNNTTQITGNIPINYAWEFGDGRTSTEADPMHLYLQNGEFVPSLTVDGFLNGKPSISGSALQVIVENAFLPLIP